MNFSFVGIPGFVFGPGTSAQAGEILARDGLKKVILIYDKGVKAIGHVDKIAASIKEAGITAIHYDGVIADPPETCAEEAAEIARKENVDGVVAIGGGSSIDTAKAVNILLTNPSPILQYGGPGSIANKGKYLMTIPTTFGTSSEFTFGAIITNSETGLKQGIGDPKLLSTTVIVDPALAVGMPSAITAATGLDCLTHAVECYTCKIGDPFDDLLAREAIRLVGENLIKVYNDGNNIDLRTNMSLATTYAGPIQCNAGVSIGHAIAHTFGSLYHIPHGFACAMASPGYIEFIADTVPGKIADIGRLLGLDIKDTESPEEIGSKVAGRVREITAAVKCPKLSDYAKESDLEACADAVLNDFFMNFAVKAATKADILKILKEML